MLPYDIVFFDIDGTLVNEKQVIPEDTKKAIRELKSANVEVVLATGRAPYHLQSVAEELEIDSHISINGAYVVHRDRVISALPLPKSSISYLTDFARRHNHPLVYMGEKNYLSSHQDHPNVIQTFHELNLSAPAFDTHFAEGNAVYQVMVYCDEKAEEEYHRTFAGISFVRWHELTMDALVADCSKARGIQLLLRNLGIPAERAVAFGDGLNDREMLSYVGMGIAMGNAHEDLKPFARFTTNHINDGGIVCGLQKIGLL